MQSSWRNRFSARIAGCLQFTFHRDGWGGGCVGNQDIWRQTTNWRALRCTFEPRRMETDYQLKSLEVHIRTKTYGDRLPIEEPWGAHSQRYAGLFLFWLVRFLALVFRGLFVLFVPLSLLVACSIFDDFFQEKVSSTHTRVCLALNGQRYCQT